MRRRLPRRGVPGGCSVRGAAAGTRRGARFPRGAAAEVRCCRPGAGATLHGRCNPVIVTTDHSPHVSPCIGCSVLLGALRATVVRPFQRLPAVHATLLAEAGGACLRACHASCIERRGPCSPRAARVCGLPTTALPAAPAALLALHPGAAMYPSVNKHLLRRAVLSTEVRRGGGGPFLGGGPDTCGAAQNTERVQLAARHTRP